MTYWIYYIYAEFSTDAPLSHLDWMLKSNSLGEKINSIPGVVSVSLTGKPTTKDKTYKNLLVVRAERQVEYDIALIELVSLNKLEIFHVEARSLSVTAKKSA